MILNELVTVTWLWWWDHVKCIKTQHTRSTLKICQYMYLICKYDNMQIIQWLLRKEKCQKTKQKKTHEFGNSCCFLCETYVLSKLKDRRPRACFYVQSWHEINSHIYNVMYMRRIFSSSILSGMLPWQSAVSISGSWQLSVDFQTLAGLPETQPALVALAQLSHSARMYSDGVWQTQLNLKQGILIIGHP